jgi:tryptophan halogenase
LCAAFAEPLEATSIHSTIVQLNMFIWDYLRDTVDETVVSGNLNTYNRRAQGMYDDFKDFLVLHYQTQRRDSEFWKYVTSGATITPFVQDVLSMSRHKLVSANDFRQFYGYAGASLWNWVLAGLGYIDQHVAARELDFWSVDREFAKYRWDAFDQSAKIESEKMYENTEFIRKR